MPTADDAVSEAIGGVLLIALVLVGAALVGTYVMSQPLPEKIPKVQFSVKQMGDYLYVVHEGGEPIDDGTIRVEIDGVSQPDTPVTGWQFGGTRRVFVGEANKAKDISVSLVYNGGSGQTLMRSVRSPYGLYVFPSRDPIETINLPPGFNQPRDFTCSTVEWVDGPGPQPLFNYSSNGKRVYVKAVDSTMTPPEPPLFICDGVDDEREINEALLIAQGGNVTLLDGHFHCSGRITVPEGTTLIGQGSFNKRITEGGLETEVEITAKGEGSGYLPVATGGEYVKLAGFTLRGNGFVMVTKSHVRVQDVYASSVTIDPITGMETWHKASGNGMFFVWVTSAVDPEPRVGGTVDDVEFYQCIAYRCHTHGFNMNQDYNDGVCRATTNIRFVQCMAGLCGYGVAGDPGVPSSVTGDNESRSEWITGFDLHEWQDLVNCEVIGCIASENWESGFHLEPGGRYDDQGNIIGPRTVSRNIVFRDCASSRNGRSTYDGAFFCSGYYLSRETTLENCLSEGNRNAGFYVHGGENSNFISCQDSGSTYGWKICKASSDITLTGCKSFNNLRWGLWLSFSQRIKVYGFEQTDSGGDLGYQNILGWYKDEPAYQQPVTDSEFSITAIGNTMPIINRAGAGNTYDLSYG